MYQPNLLGGPRSDFVSQRKELREQAPQGPNVKFTHSVQHTLSEAILSKYSSVCKGYYKDNFIKYFVYENVKRSPLLNRGYYSRVKGIRHVVYHFLDFAPPGRAQIVSLGAGFDTLFWNLNELIKFAKEKDSSYGRSVKYFEIDYGEVVYQKSRIIETTPQLLAELNNPEITCHTDKKSSEIYVDSDNYSLMSCDLTQKDLGDVLRKLLNTANFNVDLPTLILSECCLIYLEPEESDNVIKWLADYCCGITQMVMYEQIEPKDPFGRQMCDHLKRMGCELKSINKYPTRESLVERFTSLGWDETCLDTIKDMNYIYDRCLPKSDILRIQRIELFDEFEEWRMIQSHYCISVGFKSPVKKEFQQQLCDQSISNGTTTTMTEDTHDDDERLLQLYIDNLKAVFKELSVRIPAFTGEQARAHGEISLRQLAAEVCAEQEENFYSDHYQNSAKAEELRRKDLPVSSTITLEGLDRSSKKEWIPKLNKT